MNSAIEVRNFSLRRGSFSLKNISFVVNSKEIFAILGETGAGKTLLLESIAGFYKGSGGNVYLGGQPVLEIPLTELKIGFVYQDYGLFPHMTVEQNISYGLKMRNKKKDEVSDKVRCISEKLSISHILGQFPGTLSGGEKQRTALARALVLNPDILLLDEPFSALDPVTKQAMYDEILKIHEEFECAILFVTHDFNEAQKLADSVGIMHDGCLKEVRSSERLFEVYQDDEINKFFGLTR